jgi:hypothetical protein
MKTEVVIITPKMAELMLKKSVFNRPLRRNIVFLYAEVMKRGEWMLTHQGIAFDDNGNLIDGHHRLSAVILSNKEIQMAVSYGYDAMTFKKLDIGYRRTSGNIFAMANVKNYNNVAAGIANYYSFKKNLTVGDSSRLKDIYITPSMMLEEYYSKPNFYDNLNIISENLYRKVRIFKRSLLMGFMAYLILDKKHDQKFVENFMFALHGVDTPKFENAKTLFFLLIKDIASNKRYNSLTRQMMLFKAFNYDYKGISRQLIKFDTEREKKVEILNNSNN